MSQKKKLQVFISSTFTDLKEERQAAVEAILTAGHIPAGMELFTAGDESQMQVIKRWIDESDIYLLILGSRYGSIEPNSGKSYTQLEYEYAVENGKPFFATAINDSAIEKRMKKGKVFMEMDNQHLLKNFRGIVTSKMVRFWEDSRDIKIAVLETLSDFSRREDLRGWIPGNEANKTDVLFEQIDRLTKENIILRDKEITNSKPVVLYNTLTFDEMVRNLKSKFVNVNLLAGLSQRHIEEIARLLELYRHDFFSVLHVLIILKNNLLSGQNFSVHKLLITLAIRHLEDAGLVAVNYKLSTDTMHYYQLSEVGKQFVLKMDVEGFFNELKLLYREFYEGGKETLPYDLLKV